MLNTREVIKANQDSTATLPLNRKILLDTLIKHETLTEDDIAKEENLGLVPNKEHLGFLLSELRSSGHIQVLSGAVPVTYSITQKGIDEGVRLRVIEE
jgi:predicted transcriptional regulator